MAKIVSSGPGKPIAKVLVKSVTTFGTDANADITLDDGRGPRVAGHIARTAIGFVVTAASDAFPIFIGSKRVRQNPLENGDIIRVGSALLRFVDEPDTELAHDPAPEGTQRDLMAYERLLDFSRKLASETKIPKILDILMDEVIAFTRAENGLLVLLENGQPEIKVARSMRQESVPADVAEKSNSILEKVLETKRPVVITDVQNHAEFRDSASVINFRLSSMMCAPLIHCGTLFGAIYLSNNSFTHAFDETSLKVLMVFAGQASLLVQNALQVNALTERANSLQAKLEFSHFGDVIGSCSSMQNAFRDMDKVAKTDVSVLIAGETGTGKELIARELHRRSERAKGPFIVINCGAIPESLLESELFGHVKGAFTGAISSRIGRFQAAHNGTLFLDEIGEMPLHLQVKILRFLQDHCVMKVGDSKTEEVNTRILAATNRNLAALSREGSFREDLYYRLNVVEIWVPPLRERGNDVLVIANYFLQKYGKLYGKDIIGITPQAQNALLNFSWPGNVRQLENRIKRAIVLCDGPHLTSSDLDLSAEQHEVVLTLNDAIERFRSRYVRAALERNAGNKTKTARELGVDPRTVFRYLENHRRGNAEIA